jgi:hypothetical protein
MFLDINHSFFDIVFSKKQRENYLKISYRKIYFFRLREEIPVLRYSSVVEYKLNIHETLS